MLPSNPSPGRRLRYEQGITPIVAVDDQVFQAKPIEAHESNHIVETAIVLIKSTLIDLGVDIGRTREAAVCALQNAKFAALNIKHEAVEQMQVDLRMSHANFIDHGVQPAGRHAFGSDEFDLWMFGYMPAEFQHAR